MKAGFLGVALAAVAGLVISAAASGSGAPDPGDHAGRHGSHSGGAPSPARAAAARPVTYGGTMSNGWPVMVETNASGRRINRAIAALQASCTPDGHIHVAKDRWTNVPVSARGRFSAKFDDGWAEDGIAAEETYRFSGTVDRRRQRVTGKWRYTGRYTTIATGVVETCTAGALTFSARR